MNKIVYALSTLSILLLCSFTTSLDCHYASSNIDFAKSKTKEALGKDNINEVRYLTYKAINTIEKSKELLNICGCTDAKENIEKSLVLLIKVTKSTSIDGSKDLLQQSLHQITAGITDLNGHDNHDKRITTNTNSSDTIKNNELSLLEQKIDDSLIKYKSSLAKVVETVNCKDASAFIKNIIANCQNHLIEDNLSIGKKYYYLRTKEISENALNNINDCFKNQ